jgi:CRISPR-associated endonuclease Csy4
MTHYQDIKITPDVDISLGFIRNKLYQKFHKTLFDLKATDIGASFPHLKPCKNSTPDMLLGDMLRLHSSQQSLENLQNQNWLGGLSGYCQISDILPIPENITGYQNISRVRVKGSMSEADLRAKIKHKKLQEELNNDVKINAYIQQYRKEMFKRSLTNPYLELTSTSTQQRYRIYLQFNDITQHQVIGEFNAFGLSKTATIPLF